MSCARYDSDFTALHSDPRYQAIITEFDIDQSVGIIAQLCADPGKVTTVVDDRRGFYYQRETEFKRQRKDGPIHSADEACKEGEEDTLETFLKDGGQQVGGKFRQESFNGDRNQRLIFAQQTKSDVCAYRSEGGAEWTTREYICLFERRVVGLYAVSHIPDGPLAPEWDERLMRDFARAKKLGDEGISASLIHRYQGRRYSCSAVDSSPTHALGRKTDGPKTSVGGHGILARPAPPLGI